MSNKYVVRCTKRISCADAALSHVGYYRKGDFVTENGRPTRSLDRAFVYGDDADAEFPYDDGRDGDLAEYFESVPVKFALDSEIIIARYIFSDQYSRADDVVGVFTDLNEAKKCRDAGGGYIRLFHVKANSRPMNLTEIR